MNCCYRLQQERCLWYACIYKINSDVFASLTTWETLAIWRSGLLCGSDAILLAHKERCHLERVVHGTRGQRLQIMTDYNAVAPPTTSSYDPSSMFQDALQRARMVKYFRFFLFRNFTWKCTVHSDYKFRGFATYIPPCPWQCNYSALKVTFVQFHL